MGVTMRIAVQFEWTSTSPVGLNCFRPSDVSFRTAMGFQTSGDGFGSRMESIVHVHCTLYIYAPRDVKRGLLVVRESPKVCGPDIDKDQDAV